MNDATNLGKDEKQKHVKKGMQIFERIEDGFEQLHDLFQTACDAGMMDVTECHVMQNKALELKYATLGLHCMGTAVAKRNDCDVTNGGATLRGGPGR